MIEKLKHEIKQVLSNNIKGYILIFAVFFAGVALSYILNVSSGLEGEIKLYIDDFFMAIKNYTVDSEKTFSIAILGYLKAVCLLFFLSLSVIGSPGALFYVFFKGFSYGIVFVSSFYVLGPKAFLLLFCLVLPHASILVPCFTAYSLYCVKNAYSFSKGTKNIKARAIMSFVYGICCLALSSVAALIQAYVEPLLARAII